MTADRLAAAKSRANFDAARLAAAVRPAWRQQIRAVAVRMAMRLYCLALRMASTLRPSPRPARDRFDILLTGQFYSRNWMAAHLAPLAASSRCARVRIVSTALPPDIPKLERVAPPVWLTRWVGSTAGRLLTFGAAALTTRPDAIGGFHLLVNGLAAILLARVSGSRSLYFCVGGRTELLDGGVWGENRVFGSLAGPEPGIEGQLVAAVSASDAVVTMGSSAASFLEQRGVRAPIYVVPGGIDHTQFGCTEVPPAFDVILVARLARVKRVDLFLAAVAVAARQYPPLTAAVVGDGPLRGDLEALAVRLGVRDRVTFAGHRDDVARWLRRARVFVLTSESESLALSVMEALMAGLPSVVADVGDLRELVQDDVNGYLVQERTPEAFARPILRLLSQPAVLNACALEARRAGLAVRREVMSERWDRILASMATARAREVTSHDGARR